jgi:uncharacterized protein (TIGR03067 family)
MNVTLLLIMAVGFMLPPGLGNTESKSDSQRLQGTWAIASLQINGDDISIEGLTESRLTIAGEKYSFKMGETTLELTHKVNPAKKPKELDMTIVEGTMKGQTYHAIYSLEKDRFKICRNVEPDKARPTEFATKPDSGLMLIVWKRVVK